MAVINKKNAFMDFPLQISRQYGAPIEKFAVWYSLSEAENYAKTSPLAYAGQVLAVVDEVQSTVDIYKINKDGTLGQIGGVVATDDKSIVYGDDEKLKLVGFGEEYTDKEGQKQPFRAGLQLVTVSDGTGGFKLAWQLPDTTTVEGLQATIASLQGRVDAAEKQLVVASETVNGFMSKEDFAKLKGIAEGAQVNVIETIQVNGKDLVVEGKKVNIDLSGYASKDSVDKLTTRVGTNEQNIGELQTKIQGLTGAMHFVGRSTTDPVAEAGPTIEGKTDFVSGDVCFYNKKEYIYDGKVWVEFGNEGDHLTQDSANKLYVPLTRTINTKPLSADITLSAADVGAATASDVSAAKEEAIATAGTNADGKIATAKTEVLGAVDTKLEAYTNTEGMNTAISTAIAGKADSAQVTKDITAAKTEVKGYADTKDGETLEAAKAYADEQLASKNVGVTQIVAGGGLTGGTITSTGTIALEAIDAIDTKNTERTVIQNIKTDGYGRVIEVTSATIPDDTNTWREIQVNGVQALDGTTTGGALNIKAGTNTSVEFSEGAVVINADAYTGSDSVEVTAGKQINVKAVSVSKLTQSEEEMLILNCGKAQ